MKNLAIKFLGATVLIGYTTCNSFPSKGGIVTSDDEERSNHIRMFLEAKDQSAKLEKVAFNILAQTIATMVTETGKNSRNITSETCALYNGERAVEGPKELSVVYAQALNKEMSLSSDMKDFGFRHSMMEGTIYMINHNVQEVRKACQYKFGI